MALRYTDTTYPRTGKKLHFQQKSWGRNEQDGLRVRDWTYRNFLCPPKEGRFAVRFNSPTKDKRREKDKLKWDSHFKGTARLL